MNEKGELVGVALAGLVQRGVEGVRFGVKAAAAALILGQVPAVEKFDVQVRVRKRKQTPTEIFRELSPYVVMIEVRWGRAQICGFPSPQPSLLPL